MVGHPGFAKTRRQILAPGPTPVKPRGGDREPAPDDDAARVLDQYLDHLRVERRLAANSVESYARDLGRLAAFARQAGLPDRRACRGSSSRRSCGTCSRRAWRRDRRPAAVASVRGLYRYLVREGRLAASPAEDLHGGRPWPALPRYLSPDEVDRLIEQPDTVDAAGPARPDHARGAVRDRPARVGTGRR